MHIYNLQCTNSIKINLILKRLNMKYISKIIIFPIALPGTIAIPFTCLFPYNSFILLGQHLPTEILCKISNKVPPFLILFVTSVSKW